MIWRMPWAWLGLAAIAVPIVIHLLGRRRVRHQVFPSLRFLDVSRLLPARRHRISDILLLAVRIGIVAAAVAALAQPFVLTATRRQDLGRALAIVVDASASMSRSTLPARRALDAARAQARQESAGATASTTIESAQPARALPGALAWLATRPGRRELVVISDFQTGAIDARDLATVPAETGIRLLRIDTTLPETTEVVVRQGALDVMTRVTPGANGVAVEWTPVRAAAPTGDDAPVLLAGAAERGRAEAARAAAANLGAITGAVRPVAIVYPQFENRASLLEKMRQLTQPWMADAVADLRRNPLLAAATSEGVPAAAQGDAKVLAKMTTVSANRAGQPLVLAAAGDIEGRERLVLLCLADAGSLTSAALQSAVIGIAPTTPLSELESTRISEATLTSWQRAPGASAPPDARDQEGPSDGRWLWAVALVLLVVETWLRRHRRVAVPEMLNERVA